MSVTCGQMPAARLYVKADPLVGAVGISLHRVQHLQVLHVSSIPERLPIYRAPNLR